MSRAPTVLIIEDDAAIARGVGLRLQSAGYQTAVRCDGSSGLATALELRPDAVILDVNLPEMDGTEVIRRLRECPETRGISIIGLSGSQEMRSKVLGAGAQAFLLKPYDRDSLLTAVRAATERHVVNPNAEDVERQRV